MNSIQKDSQDTYLINGYNVCAVYQINGTDGTLIWTLGGLNSSFSFLDSNNLTQSSGPYKLKHMHHVRRQPLSLIHLSSTVRAKTSRGNYIAVSLFDNAYGATAEPPTAQVSSGQIILLDLDSRTASLVEHYPHPSGKLTAMFGSLSLLPNGDRFIGWGSGRDISQHHRSGRLLYHAEVGDQASLIGPYRVYKAPWIARPIDRPAVYAYAWGCAWSTAVYTSWNGATEVASYRIFGAVDSKADFAAVGGGMKRGFETRLRAERHVGFVFVEAVDAAGGVLGRSDVVKTFVPAPVAARACSKWRCPATVNISNYECPGQAHGLVVQRAEEEMSQWFG